MSNTLSGEQLDKVRNAYINAIINNVNVSTLVNIAAAKLGQDYAGMDESQLRDAVISQNNIDTWQQLIDATKESASDTTKD